MKPEVKKTAIQIAVSMSECRTAITDNMSAPEGETPEARTEREKRRDEAVTKLAGLEPEYRAALVVEASERAESGASAAETRETPTSTPEQRELVELRSRTSVARYMAAGIAGAALTGAEAEFRQAVGAAERTIPLAAFETRADVVTAAPGTVGINMQQIVPAVFARSIAAFAGIAMPRVPSGTYAVPRITTNLTAGAKAKGATQESTAGAFTVVNTTPHRISARLSLTAEDLASAGVPAFEASLRQNLMLVLADALDTQLVNGSGADANLKGLIPVIEDGTAADDATTITFNRALSKFGGMVDGLFAGSLKDLRAIVNPAVYQKMSGTVQTATNYAGETSIVDWAGRSLGGLWTNARMPASASNVGKGIAVKTGFMGDPAGADTMPAVAPVWGDIAITDPYTDSAEATQHVTLHTLVGDVIARQPDAYEIFAVKTG